MIADNTKTYSTNFEVYDTPCINAEFDSKMIYHSIHKKSIIFFVDLKCFIFFFLSLERLFRITTVISYKSAYCVLNMNDQKIVLNIVLVHFTTVRRSFEIEIIFIAYNLNEQCGEHYYYRGLSIRFA